MSALLRGIARIRSAPALRGTAITQRANITTKPAKAALGAAVSHRVLFLLLLLLIC